MTNPNTPSQGNNAPNNQSQQAPARWNRVTKWLYDRTFGNLSKLVQDTWSSIFNVFNGWLFDEFDQFGQDVKNRFAGKSFFQKIVASPWLVKDAIMFWANGLINKLPLVNGKKNYRNTIRQATKDIAGTFTYPIARLVKPHKEELQVALK